MSIVDAVFVTYKPNYNILKKSIDSIVCTVRRLYIIDNTPGTAKPLVNFKLSNIEIIYFEENIGIAQAHNIGIRKSLENKANYILLSDQDTIYPDNYIKDMLLSIESYPGRVAAVVPLYRDLNRNKRNLGFLKKSFLGVSKIYPDKGIHEIYQAIASGMIINTKHIEEIGFMDENLFIDWVDIEWCWRANRKGYKIIGNADVTINHHLGDSARKVVYTEVPLRNAARSYYMTRNAIHLALRSGNISYLYKLVIFIKAIRNAIIITFLGKPKLGHFKMVVKGFRDGVGGKLGKLENSE